MFFTFEAMSVPSTIHSCRYRRLKHYFCSLNPSYHHSMNERLLLPIHLSVNAFMLCTATQGRIINDNQYYMFGGHTFSLNKNSARYARALTTLQGYCIKVPWTASDNRHDLSAWILKLRYLLWTADSHLPFQMRCGMSSRSSAELIRSWINVERTL